VDWKCDFLTGGRFLKLLESRNAIVREDASSGET
jgi:hypothetical protein